MDDSITVLKHTVSPPAAPWRGYHLIVCIRGNKYICKTKIQKYLSSTQKLPDDKRGTCLQSDQEMRQVLLAVVAQRDYFLLDMAALCQDLSRGYK